MTPPVNPPQIKHEIMPIVCVTKDSFMPRSQSEVWSKKQISEVGSVEYSAEEIAAEKAAKLIRRKK